jgi:transposase-like protein
VALSSARLAARLSRRIDAVGLPVVIIDGIHFRDRAVLIARGFDPRGKKHVLGIRQGSTEKMQVVRALLCELTDRGLDADRMWPWVIDGAKALRRAVSAVFGASALVQRC